jgi:hypothetical protein
MNTHFFHKRLNTADILRPTIVVSHAAASPNKRTYAPIGPVSKCQYRVDKRPYLDEGFNSESLSSPVSILEAKTLGPPNWERKLIKSEYHECTRRCQNQVTKHKFTTHNFLVGDGISLLSTRASLTSSRRHTLKSAN